LRKLSKRAGGKDYLRGTKKDKRNRMWEGKLRALLQVKRPSGARREGSGPEEGEGRWEKGTTYGKKGVVFFSTYLKIREQTGDKGTKKVTGKKGTGKKAREKEKRIGGGKKEQEKLRSERLSSKPDRP